MSKCPRRRNANCAEDCEVCDRVFAYVVLPEHTERHTRHENGFCQFCFDKRFEKWKTQISGKQQTVEVTARESDEAPSTDEIQRDVDTVIRILEKYSKFPGLFRIVM